MKSCIQENFNQLADAIVRIEQYLGLENDVNINTLSGKVKNISICSIGENIESYKIVKCIDNKIYKIGNNENIDCNKIYGMSLESGEDGDYIKVLHFGVVENDNWNLNINKPIMLGMNGDITQEMPTSGFWVNLGNVISNKKIIFNMSSPIIL